MTHPCVRNLTYGERHQTQSNTEWVYILIRYGKHQFPHRSVCHILASKSIKEKETNAIFLRLSPSSFIVTSLTTSHGGLFSSIFMKINPRDDHDVHHHALPHAHDDARLREKGQCYEPPMTDCQPHQCNRSSSGNCQAWHLQE